MNIIKIIISFIVVILAMILASFKPVEEKVHVNVQEILDLPTASDLINFEVKRIKEEQAHAEKLEELDKQKREKDRRKHTASRGIVKPVSRSNTNMKTYMSWKAITNKSSKQYQLQQHPDIYTDEEGFRKIDDKFMIAVGTYFEADVGQEVEVELDGGNKFSAIVGDIKANKHVDENIQHKVDGSVIEFLVGDNLLPIIKKMGNCSYSEKNNFQGEVTSITILENKFIE